MTDRPTYLSRLSHSAHLGARFVLLVASVVALMSFGGQLFLAPVLVPLQWLAARDSDRNGRIVFTGLATLLLLEVGWIGGYIVTEQELLSLLIAVVSGGAAGLLFFWTTSDGKPLRDGTGVPTVTP